MKININDIQIRETAANDYNDIIDIQISAFPKSDVAELTADLLADETAFPLISLLALHQDKAAGHILFSKARIEGDSNNSSVYILAPLAVKPEYQKIGIGGLLIRKGLEILRNMDVKAVFVLGHAEYYPRHGFRQNAQGLGYPPPHPDPVPKGYAPYWMIQFLTNEKINKGKVICSKALDKPEHWRDDDVEIEM